jgi:hypothetical protein
LRVTSRGLGDVYKRQKQWWCAFGIHTWLPWKDPVKQRRSTYDYTEQYRACGYCNKFQRRQLSKD